MPETIISILEIEANAGEKWILAAAITKLPK
jgi:hypothetical protein